MKKRINRSLTLLNKIKRLQKERDWLALRLAQFGNHHTYICPNPNSNETILECVSRAGSCQNCWIEAAKTAVSNEPE